MEVEIYLRSCFKDDPDWVICWLTEIWEGHRNCSVHDPNQPPFKRDGCWQVDSRNDILAKIEPAEPHILRMFIRPEIWNERVVAFVAYLRETFQ